MIQLGKITQDFLKRAKESIHEIVWKSDPNKAGKWITLKSSKFGGADGSPFYYAERFGINSVAFICFDPSEPDKVLVLSQWHAPLGKFINGAFTGSIDKDLSVLEILKEEVLEEAGYGVADTDVKFVGKYPVGSQTSEQVYLFLVLVSPETFVGVHPENEFEENTLRSLITIEQARTLREWKLQIILNAVPQYI